MIHQNEAPQAAANGEGGGFSNGSTRFYSQTLVGGNASDPLGEVAWALRRHPGDLRTLTIERLQREALEALLICEGQVEVLSRHITALDGLLALLRRAPAGARYVSEALGARR